MPVSAALGIERILAAISRRPLRVRRAMLSVLFRVASMLGLARANETNALRICAALQVPRRRAAGIARDAVFHDMMFALEWLALKNRPASGLLADANAVRIEDEDIFHWASAQKTIILSTLHMASYATSLARLLHGHFQGRDIVIVRSKAVAAEEEGALAKLALIGVRVEYLFLDDPGTFLDLVRKVKRGAVLITLADLPSSYGRSCEVELLWHPARIAVGIGDLSVLCRAPVVLFKTVSGVSGDSITVEAVLEPGSMDGAERKGFADRIAGFVNAAVITRPEQWHMWDRLPEYAVPS